MTRRPAALVLATALVATSPAAAHEVLHDVERGHAVAVKAYFPDGEVLAYSAYEVYSPADAKIPWQKGRTDRAGWLAFRPDVPGGWRVKVIDASGHGLDITLPVDAGLGYGAEAPPPSTGLASAAFVLRPLVGVAVIAAIFAGLYRAYRRKGGG